MRLLSLTVGLLAIAMASTQSSDLGISHATVIAPRKGATRCSGAPQGAALKGTFYFLPKSGDTPALVTYTPATKKWGSITISSPVTSMLQGGSLAAVAAVEPGAADFLVVSGGGTKNVVSYNLQVSHEPGQRTVTEKYH